MIPPFVDRAWLRDHPEAVLADVRFAPDPAAGRRAFAAGHLPGAVYVDLIEVLSAPVGPDAATGRHPLPAPDRFAAGLGAAGIGDETPVVGYDDGGGVFAARLVWMLRAIGHDAALLDGGIDATDERETGPGRAPEPAGFTAVRWPDERLAEIEEVAEVSAGWSEGGRASSADAPGGPRPVLLDARPPERYAGAPDSLDPRAGHIPGARSFPARANVDSRGRVAAPAELRERLARVGVSDGTQVIASCGSGVTACHDLLILEWAGLRAGRLYPGSWSQWSRDPARPVATGADQPVSSGGSAFGPSG